MKILIGNLIKGRGATDSSLFVFSCSFLLLAVMLFPMCAIAQSSISANVFRHSATGRYYGKINIPAGGKYYIDFHPAQGVTTGVYSAYVDGENIYMQSVTLVEGRYMIDATDRDMAFVVRSTASDDIVAKPVNSELSDWMDTNGYYYYDATDARRNALKYATAAISNASLNSSYANKRIYVMANPARNGLAFAILNHQNSARGLSAGSLYLVSRKSYSNARPNIVWMDEPDAISDETTAIEVVSETAKSVVDDSEDVIYTLQGVRVSDPARGRLYIKNGQKFIVK